MFYSEKPKGKILGLDYGSVRIGIALSDESKTIAFGKEVIKNTPDFFNTLSNLIKRENVYEIVIGYPLNLKGQRTKQSEEVEKFEKALNNFLIVSNQNINVLRWDERLTSKIAEDSLLISGMKKKRRRDKSNIDIISAAVMLQSYLDSK